MDDIMTTKSNLALKTQRQLKRVCVLMGGWSHEREISLRTGNAVVAALQAQGFDVTTIDVKKDLQHLMDELREARPDLVFNALHGEGGEDGQVQSILDMMSLPYTHSGVLTSALGMSKPMSKQLFEKHDIPTPAWKVVPLHDLKKEHHLPLPYIIKPPADGSSLGIFIIKNDDDLKNVDTSVWSFGEDVLLEDYIEGREVTVAVLDGKALGVVEIVSKDGFVSWDGKYKAGVTERLMPAPVSQDVYQRMLDLAAKAHHVLGCKGVSRVDMMYDDKKDAPNDIYVLELNTQPGLTPTSFVPLIAAHLGVSFNDLIYKIMMSAWEPTR